MLQAVSYNTIDLLLIDEFGNFLEMTEEELSGLCFQQTLLTDALSRNSDKLRLSVAYGDNRDISEYDFSIFS